jgi:hypothetical protein
MPDTRWSCPNNETRDSNLGHEIVDLLIVPGVRPNPKSGNSEKRLEISQPWGLFFCDGQAGAHAFVSCRPLSDGPQKRSLWAPDRCQPVAAEGHAGANRRFSWKSETIRLIEVTRYVTPATA